MTIGFIGLGNMAKAMIGGIVSKGLYSTADIMGSAGTEATCDTVSAEFGIKTTTDNAEVASKADILVLAIKPQMFDKVLPPIASKVKEDTIILSIAAGKTTEAIAAIFGDKHIVRVMPNTPALVGEGASAVCGGKNATPSDVAKVMEICESFGTAEELPENMIDAFCAIAGSSPAYVFMYMEALADAGVKAGLPRDKAYKAAAQSTLGSAKLMLETGKHPGVLKDMVCSPGGTTIEAVQVLEDMGFRSAVMDAVEACVDKAKSLG